MCVTVYIYILASSKPAGNSETGLIGAHSWSWSATVRNTTRNIHFYDENFYDESEIVIEERFYDEYFRFIIDQC